MDTFLHDLRYGVRMLLRNPGFTIVAVVTLGLGIGANSAIFSVVNGVLLKPVPLAHPERVVILRQRSPQAAMMVVSYPDYLDWRTQNRVFEDIAVYNRFVSFNLTGGEQPERLAGGLATSNLMPLLGRQPVLGRWFTPADDQPNAPRTAVLTHGLWQQRFGGSPAVLGTSITLDRIPHTVIGVLPADVTWAGVDVWVPLAHRITPGLLMRYNHDGLVGLARLKPGVTLEDARRDMDRVSKQLEQRYPDSNLGVSAVVHLLNEAQVGSVKQSLLAATRHGPVVLDAQRRSVLHF